jgi:beta-galactosidase GanA
MNRREFNRMIGAGSLAAWSLGNWSLPAFGKAATEGLPLHHRGAFLVNGKPVFLIAGSIDYFRCPPELWRDRLLKAKRGGLNCIASCIMWNSHELEEGRFHFSGEHDLGRFIDLCGELGLYFYARVGPFLCDE